MKAIFTFLLLIPTILPAQNKLQVSKAGTIYMEKVIQAPQYSKKQLYKIALDWISETFKSAKDVITFKDLTIGKITGNFYTDYQFALASDTYENSFEFLFKEGRLKFKIYNITEVKFGYPLSRNILRKDKTFRKYYGLTENVNKSLNGLINSLENYINNYQSKESNW